MKRVSGWKWWDVLGVEEREGGAYPWAVRLSGGLLSAEEAGRSALWAAAGRRVSVMAKAGLQGFMMGILKRLSHTSLTRWGLGDEV